MIEVQAKDGYQAFFTYMELFNLLDESRLPVLATLENSLAIKEDGPVVLHVPADRTTGPRHVKWVTKVILHDLKQLSGTSPG